MAGLCTSALSKVWTHEANTMSLTADRLLYQAGGPKQAASSQP
jgi:hypothetical protein